MVSAATFESLLKISNGQFTQQGIARRVGRGYANGIGIGRAV
jgi:hypothetical protein